MVESQNEETWSVSYVTCVDIIAQVSETWWSISLFLPTLKLRIIIIVLPADRPEKVLPTTRT